MTCVSLGYIIMTSPQSENMKSLSKTNTHVPPNLIELRAGPGIEIYMGRNMNSSAKQIQSSVSPNLIVGLSPSLTLKAFLTRLRWSKVKNCYTTAIYTRTGGLIRFYLVIWSILSQFKWPLLFLHHRGRGRGTRLSI